MDAPTEEQKKVVASVGASLQKIAPRLVRNVNLRRGYKPLILADSVKVKMSLADDWKIDVVVRYAGMDYQERWNYHQFLVYSAEELPQVFSYRLISLITQI